MFKLGWFFALLLSAGSVVPSLGQADERVDCLNVGFTPDTQAKFGFVIDFDKIRAERLECGEILADACSRHIPGNPAGTHAFELACDAITLDHPLFPEGAPSRCVYLPLPLYVCKEALLRALK